MDTLRTYARGALEGVVLGVLALIALLLVAFLMALVDVAQ